MIARCAELRTLALCGGAATRSLGLSRVARYVIAVNLSLWMCTWAKAQRAAPPSAEISAVHLGPPQPVSPPGAGYHWFTWLAADSERPGRLLACGIRTSPYSNRSQGFVYQSVDSGVHWRLVLADSSGRYVSEETCAFGPGGTAYFVAQTWRAEYEKPRLGFGTFRLYRSADGGATWLLARVDSSYHAWFDYARLAVDWTTGPYHGQVYVFGNDALEWGNRQLRLYARPRVVFVSADEGNHFGARVELAGAGRVISMFPSAATVTPHGTVIAAFHTRALIGDALPPSPADTGRYEAPPQLGRVDVVRSGDGGRTVETAINLDSVAIGDAFPTLAVDVGEGHFRGRLYAVWGRTMTHRGGRRAAQLELSTSDDDGTTWTAPRPIVQTRSESASIERIALAVNRAGLVAVLWLGKAGQCPRLAVSTDGGTSFGHAVRLDAPCDRPRPRSPAYMADRLWTIPFVMTTTDADRPYLNRLGFSVSAVNFRALDLAADADGSFHAVWTRPYTSGRLYAATIQVRSASGHNAVAEIEIPPIDVSSHVAVELNNQDYDPGGGTYTADLSVINKDSVSIGAPVVVRVKGIYSPFGAARVLDADNGRAGIGAIWDISSRVPTGTLGPYARTLPRRVAFRLDLTNQAAAWSNLLSAELVVFAHAVSGAAPGLGQGR